MQKSRAGFLKRWPFQGYFLSCLSFLKSKIFACEAKLQRMVSFFEPNRYSNLKTLNFNGVNENWQVKV